MAQDSNILQNAISAVPASDMTTELVPVDLNSSNQWAASTAGEYSDATLQDTGESPSELTGIAGNSGRRFGRVAGTCTAGAKAAAGASGYQDAVPGDVVVGRFLETKSTVGDNVLFLPYERGQFRYNGAQEVVSADGAIAVPTENTTYFVTKAGVAAMTLVDPTATTHDGLELTFISATAQAHTLSNAAGSGFNAAGAGGDVATFGGAKGDNITIVAYQGDWYVKNSINITLG
jgi:hypothetical protein